MAVEEATLTGKAAAEALVPLFQFERLLNQDQAGRRISLLGSINDQPAILQAERAAFSSDVKDLATFAQSLTSISNLGANDIYHWYMANTGPSHGAGLSATPSTTSNGSSAAPTTTSAQPPTLKINLIYPSTAKHIAKYSSQGVRTVTETPHIYRTYIRPYMQRNRDAGRLNWVFNIIEGRTEQEDVIYRAHSTATTIVSTSTTSSSSSTTTNTDPTAGALTTPSTTFPSADSNNEGFLLLPDLNWDRSTLTSLHLLCLVERRDIWSLRDLTPAHLPWLRRMRASLLAATCKLYPTLEPDQLKLYVHYQPTYYHFHVHVVHVMLEAGATQAVGKAWGLEGVMATLEVMGEGKGMADLEMVYGVGEASELWVEVFEPLKREEERKRKRDEEAGCEGTGRKELKLDPEMSLVR